MHFGKDTKSTTILDISGTSFAPEGQAYGLSH